MKSSAIAGFIGLCPFCFPCPVDCTHKIILQTSPQGSAAIGDQDADVKIFFLNI